MTVFNGPSEPTEESPLLGKDPSTAASASSIALPNDTIRESPAKTANGPQTEDAQAEEVGEGEEPVNPMFEGLPEVAAQLHILIPAVAIGVSTEPQYQSPTYPNEFRRSSYPQRIRLS